MSKQTQTDGFGWDELWAGFTSQPLYIQQEWMLGFREGQSKKYRSEGLQIILTNIMNNSSQKVKDEVFEFAPEDVKKYFGYGVVQETKNSRLDRIYKELFAEA